MTGPFTDRAQRRWLLLFNRLGPDNKTSHSECEARGPRGYGSHVVARVRDAWADDAVHLWTARLDFDLARLGRLEGTLSSSERARAARYRTARDGARFTVRRAMLRIGLGAVLDAAPRRIRFRYT